jgi:hypothetical protein
MVFAAEQLVADIVRSLNLFFVFSHLTVNIGKQ